MMSGLMIDTDVLIDYLRGYQEAIMYLNSITDKLWLSVITVAELYAGIKNNKEEKILNNFIQGFEVVNIDTEIAKLGGHFRKQYGKSHGTGLADALIAATANINAIQLVTLNGKHFPMLTAITLPYKK